MADHLTDSTHDGQVLVIGFGNDLRGDDGVGPRVAETVARWKLSGVVALAAHQLLPELAEQLCNARLVIFVDAELQRKSESKSVSAIPLNPRSTASPLGHVSNPEQLLALARDVFGRCPPACLIRVPAYELHLSESLSPLAEAGANDALQCIANLLDDHEISFSSSPFEETRRSAMASPPPNTSTEESCDRGIFR